MTGQNELHLIEMISKETYSARLNMLKVQEWTVASQEESFSTKENENHKLPTGKKSVYCRVGEYYYRFVCDETLTHEQVINICKHEYHSKHDGKRRPLTSKLYQGLLNNLDQMIKLSTSSVISLEFPKSKATKRISKIKFVGGNITMWAEESGHESSRRVTAQELITELYNLEAGHEHT